MMVFRALLAGTGVAGTDPPVRVLAGPPLRTLDAPVIFVAGMSSGVPHAVRVRFAELNAHVPLRVAVHSKPALGVLIGGVADPQLVGPIREHVLARSVRVVFADATRALAALAAREALAALAAGSVANAGENWNEMLTPDASASAARTDRDSGNPASV
jgi:hypothetical protein